MSTVLLLSIYCGAILLASLAGGWLPTVMRLDHRRMQIALSFVAGVMLGIGLLHLVPHAFYELRSMDATVAWVLGGFMGMFFLERFFHFHHHDAPDDSEVEGLAARLRERFPELEVSSVADLVVQAKRRLVYFTQLSYVLGGMSLIVAVLLVGTLLTITVNERLGEIATLRAIGVSRGTIVRQVLAEGVALTVLGAGIGILLGLATAEYLDAILTSFPGLPAAFSFFVPRADTLSLAAVVLLVTGSLAGLYPAWLASRAPIAATLRAEAT